MADLTASPTEAKSIARLEWLLVAIGIVGLLAAPFFLYPIFLMQIMCFALFACAFNLLLGYTGLLSFGHAAFFGGAAYFCAHAVKVWGWPPEAGILLGTALSLLTAWLLYRNSSAFSGLEGGFAIDWTTISILVAGTFAASLLVTLAPARRAASIRPAIAVRVDN